MGTLLRLVQSDEKLSVDRGRSTENQPTETKLFPVVSAWSILCWLIIITVFTGVVQHELERADSANTLLPYTTTVYVLYYYDHYVGAAIATSTAVFVAALAILLCLHWLVAFLLSLRRNVPRPHTVIPWCCTELPKMILLKMIFCQKRSPSPLLFLVDNHLRIRTESLRGDRATIPGQSQ